MLLTTTPSVEGRPITRYCGIVSSDFIIDLAAERGLLGEIRDFFREHNKSLEAVIAKAKDEALASLTEKAELCGAKAVVGINFNILRTGTDGSELHISVSGTAVVI